MLNVAKEAAALQRLTMQELRSRFAEVFGEQTWANNKPWMIKRIIWRLQAMAEGGLSERARQRAAELANDADLRLSPPKSMATIAAPDRTVTQAADFEHDSRLPLPGAVLTRNYKGQTLQVKVLPHGFEYDGELFKSLSAVAKKITGSHCNGYLFFRLNKQGVEL